MEKRSDFKNPYQHLKQARSLESEDNFRLSEAELKEAVRAADQLPLIDYKKALALELVKYKTDPEYQVQPGITETSLKKAYSEVLALPFLMRLELASFYARHGAYAQARETCASAFTMEPDRSSLDEPRVKEMHNRALMMRQTLDETVGPDELERLFAENFSKLDRDGDGFVHHSELELAQYDLSLSAECQMMIRHLLCHYFEVEAAHNDEFGLDIRGISRRDMNAYSARRDASWRGLSRSTPKSRSKEQKHDKW